MNESVLQLSDWISIFSPILGIALGIIIAVALVEKVGNSILGMFKDIPPNKSWLEHEQDVEIEKSKRKYSEWINDETEKPKREPEQVYMIVGDDGELIEVVDEKPKRGTYDG